LGQAQKAAAGDKAASARMDWLVMGLKQAELMLAVQRAYEKGVDTGDESEFQAAYQSLRNFRASNQEYDQTHFVGLGGDEKAWEKASRSR
jgi:hypothetical protein